MRRAESADMDARALARAFGGEVSGRSRILAPRHSRQAFLPRVGLLKGGVQ